MADTVCAYCEQEFGVKSPDPNASHGICRRHAMEQLDAMEDYMKKANVPQDLIDQRIEQTRERLNNVKTSAPDMAETGVPPDFIKV